MPQTTYILSLNILTLDTTVWQKFIFLGLKGRSPLKNNFPPLLHQGEGDKGVDRVASGEVRSQ